ncbi:uncharacterized protein LOC118738437 [Rhagoletis pomonella]|uniref:uncharacterized protein LOC118738437 n=1 Tax=Rhagoletis pomonella TaxID=28610 RepID=UPI0017812707|nr:uncharacterized protein LOC118738437 [Rhagoletis pomonella]
MLKRSKNSKCLRPPSPPTVEEILKDAETFHVELHTEPDKRQSPNTDRQQHDWWTRFEQAAADQKSLIMLDSEIKSYKLKLESTKMELETEAQLLKNAIEGQCEQIDEVLSNGSW